MRKGAEQTRVKADAHVKCLSPPPARVGIFLGLRAGVGTRRLLEPSIPRLTRTSLGNQPMLQT
jgi:hypothetical protein